MIRLRFCFILVIFAIAAGCATNKKETYEPVVYTSSENPAPYLKVVRIPNEKLELQVAVRRFVPKKGNGAEIWLVGVTHIGESNYYSNLQALLNKMTVVLYEGVGFERTNQNQSTKPKTQNITEKRTTDSSFQSKLAHTLGLVFQLDAIDYDKSNFKNCDMTVSQIQNVFTAQLATNKSVSPEGLREWEKIKQIYQGESLSTLLMEYALKFIGSSPRMVSLVKILFIETLGKIQGDVNEWSGLPTGVKDLFQVLIQERNNLIISHLKEELSKSKKNSKIALFYGAAHMSDLEKRLVKELNYRPLDQIWYKAFSVNLKEHKITEFEQTFISNTVEMLIKEMQGRN
ncbi:MAG TPA: hypothetical protein PLW02_01785 [Verrucomicrobiota bacterium]|nr:hypothetical protein [Verrucomicrobiota bacterium]